MAILFTEIFLFAFLPNNEAVSILNEERQNVVKWFGENKTRKMLKNADELYIKLFQETGMVDGSIHFVLRHRDNKQKAGWEKMSNSTVWDSLANGIKRIWLVIRGGFFRLQVMWICFLLSLSFIVPSLVDGLVKRAISKLGESNVSLNIYNLSMPVFLSAIGLPLFLLFLPVAISPVYMLIWTVILAGSVWLISSNVQHEV